MLKALAQAPLVSASVAVKRDRQGLRRHLHSVAVTRQEKRATQLPSAQPKGKPRVSHEGHSSMKLPVPFLPEGWSPEQISGVFRGMASYAVSHEWIYQRVLQDKQQGGQSLQALRCQKAQKALASRNVAAR